jgi:hypothetical protein
VVSFYKENLKLKKFKKKKKSHREGCFSIFFLEYLSVRKFSSKYMRDMIQSPESFGTNEEQHIEGSLNQSPESFDSNEEQHTK